MLLSGKARPPFYTVAPTAAERDQFAAQQALESSQVFSLTDGEEAARQRFEQLALETFDALRAPGQPRALDFPFPPQPGRAVNPVTDPALLARLPPSLSARWHEWEAEYARITARNPKLDLYDMLASISETDDSSSWPCGWEAQILTWAEAGSLTPVPFRDRWGIITPEFYDRLRQARAECLGWFYWDGQSVRFVSDPETSASSMKSGANRT